MNSLVESARGLIFDMDGTLVDNCRCHVVAWQTFARRYGHELSAEDILAWMGAQGAYYLERIFGRPLDAAEVARYSAEKEGIYRELFKSQMACPAGLEALLEASARRGAQLAVATGGPRENVDFVLEGLNLHCYFGVIVDSSAYSKSKPDPECFLTAASRLGLKPCDCLVFEDATNGIQAAKAAGMAVIAITHTNPRAVLEAAQPDLIIDSYTELESEKVQ